MADNVGWTMTTQSQNTTEMNEKLAQDSFIGDKTCVLLGGYLLIIGVIGLFANVLIVVAYVKKKIIRSRRALLYLNLAASDIVLAGLMIPMSATAFFLNSWPFGYRGCQIYGFFGFISCTSTMVTHSYIAYERYIGLLATNTTLQTRIDYKNTAWKVALIWTYSVVWASLPFVGWSRYEYEPYKLSCTLDWYKPSMLAISFIAAAGTFTFFLPLVISAVYYTKIITIVFMNDQNTSRVYQNSVITNYRRMEFGRSKRVALMTLVLLLSFILAWGPYVVLAIMGSFGFFHLPSYRSALVAPILAKSSVFINPVITYVLVEKQFRWAVIELLCRVTIHPTAVSPRLNPMPK